MAGTDHMPTAVRTGSPIPELGPPGVHGICFSCDSIKDMDIAEETATRLGSTATWYSVGVLATDQELALRCAEFCRRHGLHALFHPLDLDVCGTDPLDDRLLRLLGQRADELNSPWLNIDLAMWVREGRPCWSPWCPCRSSTRPWTGRWTGSSTPRTSSAAR